MLSFSWVAHTLDEKDGMKGCRVAASSSTRPKQAATRLPHCSASDFSMTHSSWSCNHGRLGQLRCCLEKQCEQSFWGNVLGPKAAIEALYTLLWSVFQIC